MKNSYEWYLEHLYSGILADVVARYPDYRRGAERDMSRLLSMLAARGLVVFTIDLPALGKHLDRCLDQGFLTTSFLPLSRGKRRDDAIPRLFEGMYRRIFQQDGGLLDQPDIQAIRFLRQLLYAAKKVRIDCGTSKTVKAVAEYFQVDKEVDSPTLNWEDDDFDASHARELSLCDARPREVDLPLFDRVDHDRLEILAPPRSVLDNIQRVADITSTELGYFSHEEVSYKHGPGAVSDQRRWENKYLFPSWPEKLNRAFPLDAVGFPNASYWVDAISKPDVDYGLSDHEPPSVLIAVPKTLKTPRLIAKEPISHQWCQQGVLDFLAKRSISVSIGPAMNFRSQQPNRTLALRASLDGSLATIDLSAASDRVSCWLVERLFRKNIPLLDALQASRTRWLVNSIDKKSPKFHKLRKFSTMGSAITFPLQTYIYSVVCVGVILDARGIAPTPSSVRKVAKEVQIFGDDIIVPTEESASVIAALGHLGFKVNSEKTFRTGMFRESCGVDAFQGHDVTPAYITQLPQQARPESLIAWVEICKNFFKKGLYNASAWIESTGKGVSPLLRLIPSAPKDSGAFAWPTFGWYDVPLRKKWDPTLQRWLYWTTSLRARRASSATQGSTGLIRYFTDDPSPLNKWSSEIGLRPRLTLKARWEPLDAIFSANWRSSY
jgi:hypothetical protein